VNPQASPLEIVNDYIDRGISPVPVPYKAKGPVIEGWQSLRITRTNAAVYFNGGPQNIGGLMGTPSRDLVDVDLDVPEAVKLARHYLPETASMFGRAGNPSSHRLYRSTDIKTAEYKDPDDKKQLLELRSTGVQTVLPGSTHPSGEIICWEQDGEPAACPPDTLKEGCGKLAAATLLLRCAPEHGRHDYLLTLTGALVRKLGEEGATAFLTPLARVLIPDRARTADEVKRMVTGAAKKLKAEKPVPGWPRLVEEIGKKRADRLAVWLGPEREATARTGRPILWTDPGNTEANVALARKMLTEAP
jgi:hypothetical protein